MFDDEIKPNPEWKYGMLENEFKKLKEKYKKQGLDLIQSYGENQTLYETLGDANAILKYEHGLLTEENSRLKHRIYLKDRIEQWPLWKILGADHTLVIKGSILDRLIKTTAKLDKATECIKAVISWTNGSTLDMSVQKRCEQTIAELEEK